MLRGGLLGLYDGVYAIVRKRLFRKSAMQTHEEALQLLARLDGQGWTQGLLRGLHRLTHRQKPQQVGGVTLPFPMILAAGFVKGAGFDSEEAAFTAIQRGENIIPGWRTMPNLVGPVEFGSFTRWPRLGNAGTVLWRDVPSRSLQNRIGLKNPGVNAAAAFLRQHQAELPACYGINIAVSPGVEDLDQQCAEIQQSFAAFLEAGMRPAWFTLNVSCPNTEDDPSANQTQAQTEALCRAALEVIGPEIPLWVKVSPDLSAAQYNALMQVFAAVGVRAVVATNTLAHPTPDDPKLSAGLSGGRLQASALGAALVLKDAQQRLQAPVDVIGCGGVLTGEGYQQFSQNGVTAVQYWAALIYRGPLAAALITNEASI
jgi:dihydroorotate dehydrogenase